jgi:hypothetical protein
MQGHPSQPGLPNRLTGILGFGVLTVALFAATPAGAAGDHPEMSPGVKRVQHSKASFGADPRYPFGYDPRQQIEIYGGKKEIKEPRPLVELGQKLYVEGPLDPSFDVIGRKNLFQPAFSIFGDWRTAVAYNDNGPGKRIGQIATRLNLDFDLSFTATERIHALFRPVDRGGQFSRIEFGPDSHDARLEFDPVPRTFFFEGDIGNIIAGLTDRYQSYDLPVALGFTPLIFQNGIWVNSAIVGGAVSIVGRNSPALGISNFDVTFFAGFDQVTTPAIKDAAGKLVKSGVNVYAIGGFFEANEGYWEAGVGYIDDYRDDIFGDKSYGSATVAFTKRYGGWLSNSVRAIAAFGQRNQLNGQKTADGVIILVENSLISPKELVLVPYVNLFAGFGRPQSLLRNGDAGGVLFNTGILFQTDGLTGFPKLDDTGHDTYGAAVGVNYLFNLDQQIVLEAATVQVHGDPVGRAAKGAQYGFGARYQRNLSKKWIWRSDAMYAFRDNDVDIFGVRSEVRRKF